MSLTEDVTADYKKAARYQEENTIITNWTRKFHFL